VQLFQARRYCRGVVPRDFSPEPPALSGIAGISRGQFDGASQLNMRPAPDAWQSSG